MPAKVTEKTVACEVGNPSTPFNPSHSFRDKFVIVISTEFVALAGHEEMNCNFINHINTVVPWSYIKEGKNEALVKSSN